MAPLALDTRPQPATLATTLMAMAGLAATPMLVLGMTVVGKSAAFNSTALQALACGEWRLKGKKTLHCLIRRPCLRSRLCRKESEVRS